MAFCEFQWHASATPKGNYSGGGAQRQPRPLMVSTQFLEQRMRFHTQGHPGEPWEMLVHLAAPLLEGQSNFVEVNEAGLWLRNGGPATAGVQWHVIKERPDGAPRQLAFVLRDGSDDPQYLACDAETGYGLVGPIPTVWKVVPVPDGHVRLESLTGAGALQLVQNGRLRCLPFVADRKREVTFSMHLVERSDMPHITP